MRTLPKTDAYKLTNGGFIVYCMEHHTNARGVYTGFTNHTLRVDSHPMGWKLRLGINAESDWILQDLAAVASHCQFHQADENEHHAACYSRALVITETGNLDAQPTGESLAPMAGFSFLS